MASTLNQPANRCCPETTTSSSTTTSSGALLSFVNMTAFYAADVSGVPANGVIEILGFYSANDGGGGLFFYDATDVSSPDDGGRVIVNGSRKFKRIVSQTDPIRAEFFGAIGNVATQAQAVKNTAAIRKCVAYYNRVDLLGAAGYPDASASPTPYTYYIDNDIRVTNGTIIVGAGKRRTSIKLLNSNAQVAARVAAGDGYFFAILETNTAADPLVGSVYGLPYGKSDYVRVSGLTLDCNADNQPAPRCTIQGTDIRGCGFHCEDVLVTGVSSCSTAYVGSECFPIFATFHADTTDAFGHKIVNCEVTGVADGGSSGGGREVSAIAVSGRSGLLAEGIEVLGCYIHDMLMTSSQPSSLHGITVGHCNGALVSGNVVATLAGSAFYIDTGTLKKAVLANNIFDDVRFGFYFAGIYSGSGGAANIYIEDVLIHDNLINLISQAESVDPAIAFYGVILGANPGISDLTFNRVVVRENTVYGLGFTQPITTITADTTLGDAKLTNVSPVNVSHAGYFVTGTGMPANTVVYPEPSGGATTIALNNVATANGSGVSLALSQKYYPRGFGLLTSASTAYSGVLVQDNVFETPDVGVLDTYYLTGVPYSLAGYVAFTYSMDADRFKWAFNRNKLGEAVPATVVYSNFYPAYRLDGGGMRVESTNPTEWPTDIDLSWYNSTTRNRFSAKTLFTEVASGDLQDSLLYRVALGIANTDIVNYNAHSANCDTVNTSQVVTVPDTSVLGINYLVVGTGIPVDTYVTEIQGPTKIKISAAATATNVGVSLSFKWRAAFAGQRAGTCTFTLGSPDVTCADTSLINAGEEIQAARLPGSTRILSVTGATTFTVTANATAAGSEVPWVLPNSGALGNGGTFDCIPSVDTYTATGAAKVYEHLSYSWQIDGDNIWQYGVAQTFVSVAVLDRDRMFYGHFSVIFGTDDSEKYVYIADPAAYAGRQFFLIVKKGATTGARAINLRVGTPSSYATHKLLAPGIEFESDASGYVDTVPISRPTTGVALTGVLLRAQVDGSGWIVQSRAYEAGSKCTFTPVTATNSVTLLDSSHQLEGVVQVIFDTTDADKTILLPVPTNYAGRSFELIAYKSATAGSRKVSLGVFGGGSTLLDPGTSAGVASVILCAPATGVVANSVLLTCDGANWFFTYRLLRQISEAVTLGFNYALTNAWADVILNGSAQTVSLPIPGTYLVTYSYGAAGAPQVAPKGVFARLYDTVAGAAVAKSLLASIPQDKDVDDSDSNSKTFLYQVAAATTLKLQAYQDTAATATIYGDYTYVGAVMIAAT